MSAIAALVMLLAPLAGCAQPGDPDDAPDGAPAWGFVDTEGTSHSNATAAGEPAVLFFMATWCGSCRLLTQEMVQVRSEFGEEIGLYSISIDTADDDGKLEAWKGRREQPWPHGRDERADMQRTFGIVTQSSVVVLDAEGRLVRPWGYGQATAEAIGDAPDVASA